MNIGGQTTIKSIVAQYKLDHDIEGTKWDLKLKNWASDCFIELGNVGMDTTVAVELPISDRNTVQLPDDFMDYIKIGIYLNGRMRVFSRDSSLKFDGVEIGGKKGHCEDKGGNSTSNTSNVWVYEYHWGEHYRDGNFVGEFYSSTSKDNRPLFRVNRRQRRIRLSSDISGDYLALEYKSTGVGFDGNAYIDRVYKSAIYNYLEWRQAIVDRSSPVSRTVMLQGVYEDSLRNAVFRASMFTPEEFLDAIYSTYKSTIKP